MLAVQLLQALAKQIQIVLQLVQEHHDLHADLAGQLHRIPAQHLREDVQQSEQIRVVLAQNRRVLVLDQHEQEIVDVRQLRFVLPGGQPGEPDRYDLVHVQVTIVELHDLRDRADRILTGLIVQLRSALLLINHLNEDRNGF